jgi:hypothetical protein
MSINFDESIRAVYYLSGHQQDWLAGLNEEADGSITMQYRFRYYDPKQPHNDAFSGQDTKRWFTAHGKPGIPTLADALVACQKLMDELQAAGYVPKGGCVCKLVRGTMTQEQMMAEFSKLPFVHKRDATPEEAVEMRKEFGDER